MADTTVSTDVHEPFNVHLHFRAQCTFHFVLIGNQAADLVLFVIVPVLNLFVEVYFGSYQYLGSQATADTVDVS